MNICLIPARYGSKRLKRKNIKLFYGKPLIEYAIRNAKKSKLFDKIIVSTDSKIIAKISKKYGADIPFMRPKKISDDKSTDEDVRNHFYKYCKKNNIFPQYICYLYATTPLLKPITLIKSFNFFKRKKKFRELTTITKRESYNSSFFIRNRNGEIKKIKNYKAYDSQIFFDAGQFYWINFKSKNNKILGYEININECIDINDLKDFHKAKKMYISGLKKKI